MKRAKRGWLRSSYLRSVVDKLAAKRRRLAPSVGTVPRSDPVARWRRTSRQLAEDEGEECDDLPPPPKFPKGRCRNAQQRKKRNAATHQRARKRHKTGSKSESSVAADGATRNSQSGTLAIKNGPAVSSGSRSPAGAHSRGVVPRPVFLAPTPKFGAAPLAACRDLTKVPAKARPCKKDIAQRSVTPAKCQAAVPPPLVCRHWKAGQCSHGGKCRFAHSGVAAKSDAPKVVPPWRQQRCADPQTVRTAPFVPTHGKEFSSDSEGDGPSCISMTVQAVIICAVEVCLSAVGTWAVAFSTSLRRRPW